MNILMMTINEYLLIIKSNAIMWINIRSKIEKHRFILMVNSCRIAKVKEIIDHILVIFEGINI